jgi:2-iminobutanoate/2-iminopropanoate deaminase
MLRMLLLCAVLAAAPLQAQKKKAINPPEFAPAAGAPAPMFSPGILVDGTLYVAGQVGADLKTNQGPDDFEAEVKLCIERIGYSLKAAGMTFDNVVAVNVYLTDMTLFPRMNAVYGTYFKAPRPVRTTVGTPKLAAATAHMEMNVIAHK